VGACGPLAALGGGDVKGRHVRYRRRPDIGRSVVAFARTVRGAVTEDANKVGQGVRRDEPVGAQRCVGKWRIEVRADVPKIEGIILLVGPARPWLR
jgi:hypothetical protein